MVISGLPESEDENPGTLNTKVEAFLSEKLEAPTNQITATKRLGKSPSPEKTTCLFQLPECEDGSHEKENRPKRNQNLPQQ